MTAALSNDEIESRYFLTGRMEIHSVLNDLVHRREPIGIHFNGGRDFLLSTLLEVRSDVLIFDLGGHEVSNRALQAANGGVMVATPDGVRVQFSVGQVHRFMWGDADAFWVLLPERVVRMQRREFFRITPSLARPQPVDILPAEGGLVSASLHNVGVGGIGVHLPEGSGLEIDMPINGVELIIPGHGDIVCAGVVRHVTPMGEDRGTPRQRVGIRFVGLGRRTEIQLQRFIVHIEHERRRLLDG